MKIKKLLSILLIAVMAFTMLPAAISFQAAAENEFPDYFEEFPDYFPEDAQDTEHTEGEEDSAAQQPPAFTPDNMFVWPLEDTTTSISSPFGFRRSSGRMHLGIDVLRPVGTPILAAASGTIRTSTREGAWGNLIVIDHDYPFENLSTFYSHLDRRDPGMTPGTRVEAGQRIGTAGRTGNATAPHLHFELRINNMPVNPIPFFHDNETRADVNPNPLFIRHEGHWVFNLAFDHTFTVHEYSLHRQGNSAFLLPRYDGAGGTGIPAEIPTMPQESPAVIYDPNDLGLIPQTPEIIDSYAFGASRWAATEIDDAIRLGILPENLLYDFQNDITRAEFAEAAVRAILVIGGALSDTDEDEFAQYVSMLIQEYDPFDDTDNMFVIIAHYLHIVNGVGERTFAPYNSITRQEAATMLGRIVEAFGVTESGDSHVSFVDSALFAPWASESIDFVSSFGIMGGIGNNEFSPIGPYTREQTFVTMARLAEVVTVS